MVTNGTSLLRRLPNAEHLCYGHQMAIFQNIASFYLSLYEVGLDAHFTNY